MTDGLTPTQRAFLQSQYHREAFEDMSAQEINALPMASYAKIREHAGLPPIDPYTDAYSPAPPGRPRQAQEPAQTAPEPQGVPDFGAMGMREYGAVRSKYIRPSSGSGVGIFGS